ncbi:MAG: 2-hydroxyacid dehydrogenase [Bacteroides sp.]|nr:2-hydroxyacid dehydrogenase [Bacteroides sp.]
MSFTIAFFGTQPYDEASFNEINIKYGFEIKYFKGHLNLHNVVLTKGVDAVCIFVNDSIDTAIIDALVDNGVHILALRCAGYNNVDITSAQGRLKVVRVPAYSPYAVAEHTVALMLSLNRKIPRAAWRTRDGNFSLNGLLGFDMHGKTAGIIGTGKIAKVLIHILRGLCMNILAYDIYPDHNFARENQVVYTSLDELYRYSDIISLHCPLTPETKYLINDYSISKMKDGVMIINTGRGQLIHTTALIEGLKNKKIGSAGLDVYEEENEYFYEDQSDRIIDDDVLARLLSFNNVIVTSHQAFFTREALENIASTTLQNIQDFISGKVLINEVTV